ncbi:MAG TPA: tRNA (adenosine(37)-N6)-dimethylallyltransferase MiaA [Paracoccaceae bacterium]|nr:tRNA (adenosine(37)-N6)-dimethylallyltransferase MiaA [Paracoccaceae bacterium]
MGSLRAELAAVSREAPVLVAGPTASGKSALAMELAARDGRLIVNADALQVYGCWRILTARPPAADEAALPHALYGHVARDEDWSVGHWLRAVAPLLARPVVIVGGTGLYFTALTEGLAEIPPVPAMVRAEAGEVLAAGGVAALIAGLDPATAARIDLLNPVRVQRAWEVLRATGRGLADWQADTAPPLLRPAAAERLLVMPDRDTSATRILHRLRAMVAQGALNEVAAELPHWDPARPSGKAIGVAEFAAHLRGETTLEQAIEDAATATRQYAKRQRSWFRGRMADWRRIAAP